MKAFLLRGTGLFLLLALLTFAKASNTLPRVRLKTTLGDIVLEIDTQRAPLTAGNFLRYVDEDRLRDARFYRVVTPTNQPQSVHKIEVIQGGLQIDASPQALPSIAHEPTSKTGLRHHDGTISMARNAPGSAASEIFICINDQPELDEGGRRNPDGQGFAAFGRVVQGMDVVRAIQQRPEQGQMLKGVVPFSAERITKAGK